MPIQAPKIDARTYDDIVARTQQLASQFTASYVEATVAALTGRILDEDIVKPGSTQTAAATTRALAPGPDDSGGIWAGGDAGGVVDDRVEDGPILTTTTTTTSPTPTSPAPTSPTPTGTTASPTPTGTTTTNANLVAAAGTVVDAALAQQISVIRGTNRVRVRGWQAPGTILAILPTVTTLTGQTLAETITDSNNRIVAGAGTLLTRELATRIVEVKGAQRVRIVTQPDLGATLIRIFGRMVDLTIQRVNAAPEKNFLAFLDLIGTRLLPPQAARVPLTFRLAPSATSDALVRARTPVAAPPTEQTPDAIVFETERDLWVTPVQLMTVLARTPDADSYGDYSSEALGLHEAAFPAFVGSQPIEHSLYLARNDFFTLPGTKTVSLNFTTPDAAWLSALPLSWSYWDGAVWQTLTATSTQPAANTWRVSFANLPIPASATVAGRTAHWIRARLQSPLPWGQVTVIDAANALTTIQRQEDTPSAAFAGNKRLDLTAGFFPFGTADAPNTYFYVNTRIDPAFMRPGAILTLDLGLQSPGVAATGLVLTWDYGTGTTANPTWTTLGRSSNTSAALDGGSSFNDSTLGMTRSGTVRFQIPQQWQQRPFQGVTGYWLRIGVSASGYGSGSAARPPQVQRLRLRYEWALPRVQGITTNVVLDRTAIKPSASFVNTQPLDVSKDVYPFGERPRFNDAFYLACGEVLGRPGAEVTLRLTLTNPNPTLDATRPTPPTPPLKVLPSTDLVLAWEFWNGSAWQELGRSSPTQAALANSSLGFADNTRALTANSDGATGTTGTVKFRLPATVGPSTINGVTNHWLRVRIAQGNYGLDAYYTQATDKSYTLVPDSFRPPVIRELRLDYRLDQSGPLSDCLSYNDFSAVDHTQAAVEGGTSFLPFLPTSDTRPTLYLGFDRPFARHTTTLYAQVEPPLFSEISRVDQQAQPEPAQIVWEYYGSGGWSGLGVHDETRALAERGLLLFIGPADFQAHTEFGRTQYWLRARWESGQFRAPPRLRRLLTNTTWASQTTTIQQEVLGSSDASASQRFHTTRAPVLLGQAIEVYEREPPLGAERAAIEALEGRDALTFAVDDLDHTQGVWVRWHAVDDFYTSGPRDRHYVFDHISGEVRFGDGQHGLVPPRGRNNIRAARYQVGGGEHGNLPAGTITQLKSSVAYIAGVTNLERATNGVEQETLAQLKERGPRALRHHGRAVTAQDFEDLAQLASPHVARARAITPDFDPTRLIWLDPTQPVAPSGGSAQHQAISAGRVDVIIVPRSMAARPVPDLGLIAQVEEQLRTRCGPTTNVWITGPDWIEVRVTVQVVPVSLAVADALAVEVDRALQRFLHPLVGGLDGGGWAFGRRPYPSDLYAFIESIVGVDHIHTLTIDTDTPDPARLDRFLVCSGQHQVSLIGLDQGA